MEECHWPQELMTHHQMKVLHAIFHPAFNLASKIERAIVRFLLDGNLFPVSVIQSLLMQRHFDCFDITLLGAFLGTFFGVWISFCANYYFM